MSLVIDQWKKDEQASFAGWDFAYVADRIERQDPPWSYLELARKFIEKSKILLDMGTGSGRILSSLAPFPGRALATESHSSSFLVARENLDPLGVEVVDTSNMERGKLPFKDQEFDLVLNRHEYLGAEEIFRIMTSGGTFLTQQFSAEDTADLAEEFDESSKWPEWDIGAATRKLYKAGFKIDRAEKRIGKIVFKDVGAIVYWLKAIPWKVENFSVDTHLKYLKKLQEKLDRGENLEYTEEQFLIIAKKP